MRADMRVIHNSLSMMFCSVTVLSYEVLRYSDYDLCSCLKSQASGLI